MPVDSNITALPELQTAPKEAADVPCVEKEFSCVATIIEVVVIKGSTMVTVPLDILATPKVMPLKPSIPNLSKKALSNSIDILLES